MSIEFKRMDKSNVADCIRGWKAAFPNWSYEDAMGMAKEQVESLYYFGAYEKGIYKGLIVGADTTFNFRGVRLNGIELDHLHVEPLYRKQGVSAFLIKEFQKFAIEKGYSMINVGPFSTEFYRNMGYGFGSKVMTLTASPGRFQYFEGATAMLEYYDGEKYKDQVEAFVREKRISYHGGFNFKDSTLEDKFNKMADKNRIVVLAVAQGKICGLIHYEAAGKIVIEDLFFDGPQAMKALSSYMHGLKGNIESITIENAYPAILAVCNEPTQIILREESMIKVIQIGQFLEEIGNVDFEVEDLKMTFKLRDALTGEIESLSLACENGRLRVTDQKDCPIQIEMNLSDFTTMLFSQQTFHTYAEVGLARINHDALIPAVSKVFSYDVIPYNI